MILAAMTMAIDGTAGPYRFSLRTDPTVVPVGKAKIILSVTDGSRKPVSGATVKVLAKMPGMNMGEREEVATPGEKPGLYVVPAVFSMAGQYDVTVSISSDAGSGQSIVQLHTGDASTQGPNPALGGLIALGVVAVAALVLWRMRATGQSLNARSVLNRTVLLSLAMLVAALAVGTWAVRNLRREGAMTPLEAQVMEMNTPAPEGRLPVTVAEAKEEPFASTISYSGQVIGFVEQEINPRISGTIVEMPVYVGDRVKRGQRLARLDTTQVDPMVAEKSAGLSNAGKGVAVANAELRQARNMVEQAKAEAAMAETEVSEARSMFESAKAARASASAGIDGAVAERKSAQAELEAARADQTYQSQDLERNRQLLAKGAISRDEWQLSVSMAQKSEAALAAVKERVMRAGSMVAIAQSEVRKADAEIAAAQSRVAKAQANHRSKLAGVRTAIAGIQSAQARLGQSQAAVSEASASLRGVETQQGYSELRAEVDGVVTQRLVSPGVVVAPGQAVLKVAQIAPVRLQANVPQQDLARVRVGDPVQVLVGTDAQKSLAVQVTTVSPAIDPSSRMGVVEAVYANPGQKVLPGQFITMEIAVDATRSAVVVPTDSLVTDTHNGRTTNRVWVVAAGTPGRLTATRREVVVLGQARNKTAIRSGLRAGERVVVAPFGLSEGMQVQPIAEPAKATDNTIRIELTGAGYVPDTVQIKAGTPTKLVFIRKVADTCGTAVDFPALGIHVETPLNKPVTVEIPAQTAGKELTFTCPMNMYKGKAVVK